MVIERYDPPVLIIHVRWHETAQSFGKLMRYLLYLSYAGNEDSVSAGPTGPGYHTRQPFRTDYAGSVEQTRGQRQTGRNDLPGRVRELLNGW